MPDKRTICSMADSIVFDFIPKKVGNVIDQNVGISEDIRAVVKGMKDETLVLTNKGAYVIKKGECHFFPYNEILEGKNVYRVYRRGRFEVPLKGKGRVKLPDESKEPDFGPDPADNVVNFPWSKVELFKKAEEILSINKELYDTKNGIDRRSKYEENDYIKELITEIKSLNQQLEKMKDENK